MLKRLILLLPLLVACSTTENLRSRNLYITPQWIRNTLDKEYLGPKIIQTMSPFINEDLLFQGNGVDGFVAFHKGKGTVAWKKNLKNGASSGANIKGQFLYFGSSDGQFYAVNKRTGETLWSFPTQAETLSAPTISDSVVYFLTSTSILYALDVNTGKVLWNYNRREKTALSIRANTTPIVDGNFVYAGFNDGFLVALGRTDGTLKWEKQLTRDTRFRDIDATPVISGNVMYASSYEGGLFAMEKTTGKTLWTFEQGGFAPVTVQDKRIYFSSTNGSVYSLDKDTGKLVWTYKVSKGVPTQPLFYKELILFGESMGSLVVLQALDGKFVKSFTTGEGISARPSWDSETDNVYVMSNHGLLYALELSWRRPQQSWPWETAE